MPESRQSMHEQRENGPHKSLLGTLHTSLGSKKEGGRLDSSAQVARHDLSTLESHSTAVLAAIWKTRSSIRREKEQNRNRKTHQWPGNTPKQALISTSTPSSIEVSTPLNHC